MKYKILRNWTIFRYIKYSTIHLIVHAMLKMNASLKNKIRMLVGSFKSVFFGFVVGRESEGVKNKL